MNENKMGVMEVKKLLVTMSVPIVISMLVQALYNIVDSMFVARISNDALSAVSLCYPVQTILVSVACGVGVGINALLSRYLGQNQKENATQTALHGLALSVMNGILFAVIGLLFSEKFLRIFTDSEEIIQMGTSYMHICMFFSFGIFIQIMFERIMQATGNPFYNMIIQGIGALINIILDPIFIFGLFGFPRLGVTGAAIATVIGQIVAMILGIYITSTYIKDIELTFSKFHPSIRLLKDIYRLAFPAILMQSVMSFMNVFMNLILTTVSVLAVSVFGIYFKLQQFIVMGLLGITNALIPIISYNYGAKKYDRIHQSIRFSLILSVVIMLSGTILFRLFPTELLSLFHADHDMLAIGIPALKTISLSFVFAGISMILSSSFQALDCPYASLVITLLRQLILLIPLAFLFTRIGGLHLCWYAFLLTEGVSMCLSLIFYKHIRKKYI